MSAASKAPTDTKGTTMRRTNLIEEEILKTDPVSEVILTASAILLFLPLLVLLILAFSHIG
jgi:hypothetical protein